jgi:hypothetical protein
MSKQRVIIGSIKQNIDEILEKDSEICELYPKKEKIKGFFYRFLVKKPIYPSDLIIPRKGKNSLKLFLGVF